MLWCSVGQTNVMDSITMKAEDYRSEKFNAMTDIYVKKMEGNVEIFNAHIEISSKPSNYQVNDYDSCKAKIDRKK